MRSIHIASRTFTRREGAQRSARAMLGNPKAREGIHFVTTSDRDGWHFRILTGLEGRQGPSVATQYQTAG